MQGEEWVIDTVVLAITGDHRADKFLDAIGFLDRVRLNHHIALDSQREIEAQYRRNIDRTSYAHKWLSYMASRAGKMTWCDGRLSDGHTAALIDRLGFDRDDLVFVAVASKGSSKLLVSEDSDYDEPVNKYLKDELGVTTYRIEDARIRAEQ
ncbi:MAG: hypothetical protein IIA01_04660 [Proteobacteria bacterium]|nr:hypothetical protein [Pseudomonadota bacterium]